MASAQEASRAMQSLKGAGQEAAMRTLNAEQVTKFKEAIADVNAQREKERAVQADEDARLAKIEVPKDTVSAFAKSANVSDAVALTFLRKANGDVEQAMLAFVSSEPYPELVRFTANVIA